MAYEFFLSYTRANNDPYLRQFFEDVCEVVRDRRGLPKTATVAFFDQNDIELGEDWEGAIVEALQTSRVVVPVFSPGYFKSEYCGKELGFFRERLAAAVAPGEALPPLIKPIIWVPFTNQVPAALTGGQYKFGDPGALHNTRGFKYLLKQLQQYKTEYTDQVEKLAVEIMSAADAHALPRLPDVPSLKGTESLFQSAPVPGARAAAAAPPPSPKHVRFVYVASSPRDFGDARPPEAYLESGGGDWKPFYPASLARVHRFVQNVVSADDLDFTSEELLFGPNLVAEVGEAWTQRQIVVLIVDGWSVRWDREVREILSQLDQRLDYHWCVLVPWNENDGESVALRAQIAGAIGQTFDRHANLARNPMFYRDGIKSAEELKAVLREVLTRLKDEIRKRASVDMPVPAGPEKSVLQGPSHRG